MKCTKRVILSMYNILISCCVILRYSMYLVFSSAAVNYFHKKAISLIFYKYLQIIDINTPIYLSIPSKYRKIWQKNVGAFTGLFRVITLSRAHDLDKKYVINMKYFKSIMSKHPTKNCTGNIRYSQYSLDYLSQLITHRLLLVVKTLVSSECGNSYKIWTNIAQKIVFSLYNYVEIFLT